MAGGSPVTGCWPASKIAAVRTAAAVSCTAVAVVAAPTVLDTALGDPTVAGLRGESAGATAGAELIDSGAD